MKILVLDTIHGGKTLAHHLSALGHSVDMVDVYRHASGISEKEALARQYDLITAPVHLDPDHPLMRREGVHYCSHHEAVRKILIDRAPHPMIEITGSRGKTTTATALAHLMEGPGVLHASRGTWSYPEHTLLWKRSITPASVIEPAEYANREGRWLIAEESLGVSGAGDLGILTSDEDYLIAGGKKHAIDEKKHLLAACPAVITAPGIIWERENVLSADDLVSCEGDVCRYEYMDMRGSFRNPLLRLAGYRNALMTAAAAALLLGTDPAALGTFEALPGRMAVSHQDGRSVLDNSNSGTNTETTCEAVRYARLLCPDEPLTLVIGLEAETICEGFPDDEITRAIDIAGPDHIILIGEPTEGLARSEGYTHAGDLSEGLSRALATADSGIIVLSVKTWR